MIRAFIVFACIVAAVSARAQHPVTDDQFEIRYPQYDDPRIDSLRSQIDSLSKQLELLLSQPHELEIPQSDLDPLNPNRTLKTIPGYRLEIPDELWPRVMPGTQEYQIEPPDLRKFNTPWLPDQPQNQPRRKGTPVPDFPGWEVQQLSGNADIHG